MIDPKKIKKISPKQIDQTNIDPKTIDKGTLEPELTIPIDSKQTKPKKMSR
ncbi:MAG: hypothetical protein GWN56_01995 [Nitrosopumilaceae archaeon]|nr:hypothetical protein [Nitrosopumilaceae archaeon]NIV64915.1 hypothetical protein [Nitrosopumilaceae archaeon]